MDIARAPIWRAMDADLIAAGMMVASGSIHAVVNAIVKGRGGAAAGESGGHDIMAGRAATDGVSALLLLPAIAWVPRPSGAWDWLAVSAVVHVVYLYAMIRTYTVADFSAAYPVLRGTAPLVTAAAPADTAPGVEPGTATFLGGRRPSSRAITSTISTAVRTSGPPI